MTIPNPKNNNSLNRVLLAYGKTPTSPIMTALPKRNMIALMALLAKAKETQLPVFDNVSDRVPTFKRGNTAHVVL